MSRVIFLILLFCMFSTFAAEKRQASKQLYNLRIAACNIQFEGMPSGYTKPQGVDADAGFVSLPAYGSQGELSISFNCVSQPAGEVCPGKGLKQSDEDEPSTWKIMDVRRYAPINDRYGGEAFARNLTGVPLPRGRMLSFCIGDDHRTLFGRSIVGTENHNVVPIVLDLLKTVRFVD